MDGKRGPGGSPTSIRNQEKFSKEGFFRAQRRAPEKKKTKILGPVVHLAPRSAQPKRRRSLLSPPPNISTLAIPHILRANQSRFLGRGCDEAFFSEKNVFFSEKGGGNSVNEGLGKDFYRKGNSVKRFGPFTEPPDSEKLLSSSPARKSTLSKSPQIPKMGSRK